jgi:hypothetical protein
MNTILILYEQIIPADDSTPTDEFLSVWIEISDGVDTYNLPVGGLDPEGDTQAELDARFDELFALAATKEYVYDDLPLDLRKTIEDNNVVRYLSPATSNLTGNG